MSLPGPIYPISCETCGLSDLEKLGETFGGSLWPPEEDGMHVAIQEYHRRYIPGQVPEETERRGRILEVRNIVCPDCGSFNRTASLTPDPKRIPMFASIGIVLVALVYFLSGRLVFLYDIKHFVAIICFLLPVVFYIISIPLQYSKVIKPLKFKSCVHCGAEKYTSLWASQDRNLKCPICEQDTLHVHKA